MKITVTKAFFEKADKKEISKRRITLMYSDGTYETLVVTGYNITRNQVSVLGGPEWYTDMHRFYSLERYISTANITKKHMEKEEAKNYIREREYNWTKRELA